MTSARDTIPKKKKLSRPVSPGKRVPPVAPEPEDSMDQAVRPFDPDRYFSEWDPELTDEEKASYLHAIEEMMRKDREAWRRN